MKTMVYRLLMPYTIITDAMMNMAVFIAPFVTFSLMSWRFSSLSSEKASNNFMGAVWQSIFLLCARAGGDGWMIPHEGCRGRVSGAHGGQGTGSWHM